MERQGIPTVCIQLLREAAEAVRMPRGLFVPFRHGFPLDSPNEPNRQRSVIEAALAMIWNDSLTPPALLDYEPAAR